MSDWEHYSAPFDNLTRERASYGPSHPTAAHLRGWSVLRPQASRIDRARTSKTGGNIAGVELLHFRELLLQSGQLVAQAKVFRVPFSVFGRTGRLNLALMKGTPRAQMG